jgi:8-oxo-dGTP pyrophosphatase MutT (NUDIX family)
MHRHFTATAFVIDRNNERTLLLWHRRLKRWMPPGGHVDPDETPEETARRECKEETNLDVEIIGDAQEDVFRDNPNEGRLLKKPFALLLEEIPPYPERGEDAHQHMDFVYLARPIDEKQTLRLEDEAGTTLRWFTRKEVEALNTDTEIFANVKQYILSTLQE